MSTASAIIYIAAMDIDSMILTGKQVAQIRQILDLDVRTDYELGSLRNEVVRTLADASSAARGDNDWKAFDRLNTAMSAITAVIDDTMYRRNVLR